MPSSNNTTSFIYYKHIRNKLNNSIKNNDSINIQNKYERILLQIQNNLSDLK